MSFRKTMKRISLSEYTALCTQSDVSPNYSPQFVEYYFTKLNRKPVIKGKYDSTGRLIAAFPVLFLSVFPNSIHKRLLGEAFRGLGDIGQPEILIPVLPSESRFTLH